MKIDPFSAIIKIASVLSMIVAGTLIAEDGQPNPSIRPAEQTKALEVFAEALYWYTSETVDWADTVVGNNNSFQSDFKTLVFHWAPGFRIGEGYNLNHDGWNTQASYTWFQTKAKDHTQGPVNAGFLAARFSDLEPFSAGKARLLLHYNILDWDIGRGFLVSKHVLLRPSIGLKGGWITQTIHSSWSKEIIIPIPGSETLKHNFQCVGPKGALSTQWCLGDILKNSFSVMGQIEAGYLWGHWSIRDKYFDVLDTLIYLKTSKRNFGSFVLHAFLGFGWDANFHQDRLHFHAKFGYEIEDWFNQLQIFTDTSGSQNNDLIMQGLNLSFHLTF